MAFVFKNLNFQKIDKHVCIGERLTRVNVFGAATNTPLGHASKNGEFCAELYLQLWRVGQVQRVIEECGTKKSVPVQ